MTINQTTVNGKWLEIKGEVQKAWGTLTADDIEQTKGDIHAIAGLVLQKCGKKQEEFQKTFSEIIDRVQAKKESIVESIKQDLKA